MIAVRTINIGDDGRVAEGDYALLEGWWKVRAREAPPRNILPTLGVMASSSSNHQSSIPNPQSPPLAAAFAYLDATGSGVAWVGWMITDPAAPKALAGRAMLRALDFLEKECRRLGYWLGWATVADASFIRFLEARGYTRTDEGLCHLFKTLPDADMPSSNIQ
jgi:hypothetical protein